MKVFYSVVAAVLLMGCTHATLDAEAEKVVIVDSISPSDLLVYDRVAELKCLGMSSLDFCRKDLRNQAAAIGATVVKITSTEPAYCALDALTGKGEKKCLHAYGDAFKPKTQKY